MSLGFFLIQMQCILEDQLLEASYRGSHHQLLRNTSPLLLEEIVLNERELGA